DLIYFFFFFSSRRRHTRFDCDWSSDVCSSDLAITASPTARNFPGQAVGDAVIALRRIRRHIGGRNDDFSPVGFEKENFFAAHLRSEERRVGKECSSWGWRARVKTRGRLSGCAR